MRYPFLGVAQKTSSAALLGARHASGLGDWGGSTKQTASPKLTRLAQRASRDRRASVALLV